MPLVIARRIVGLRHPNAAGSDDILNRGAASQTGFSGRPPQPRRQQPIQQVLLVAAGKGPARSERHAYPYAPPPDHAAFLSDLAVKKLEALGQIDHRKYFEAGPAWGVIDQTAGNRRQPRTNDNLGLACLRSRGPNALIEPRELALCHNNPWSMQGGYGTLKGQWLKIAGRVEFDVCVQDKPEPG